VVRAPQAVLALVAVTVVAIAVGESSAHGRDSASARAPGRPNIVVLTTDDETVEDMAAMPRTRVPVWLQRAGYVTDHIGKYMNGYGTQVKADVPPGCRSGRAPRAAEAAPAPG
jgi:hypothetical protein